jgi:dTDP-3-amino-2,3,6-trideoxy-4-keto-D-glucose/dTDP-3-amino-3,4,6-trideoxy-alpha-D-glucose/dTDP-2,6-dideoxy-D-kanosamine transaminase
MNQTSARIPRFDCREQYRTTRAQILDAVDQVLQSGCLVLGPHVRAFEEKMCQFLGVPQGFGVGVGNGTDALAIALRALGIGCGHEVITVANTAVATVSAIRMAGATPVFCDIDRDTLMMDPRDAQRRITARTRAIVPVHLFGNAVDMAAVVSLARQYRLHVVEDCAQSCGTSFQGRATGTWGDVGCFSFYPTKNLAAYGDGGLCFTRNAGLANTMRQIRSYGCTGASQEASCEGVNSRLDEVQAAILEVKLQHLPRYLQGRRRIAAVYRRYLSQQCAIPRATDGAEHSYHLFVVEVRQRQHVITQLRLGDVEPGVHYATPIHLMNAYRFLGYRDGALPVTERAAGRVLSLPCYPELPEQAVQGICAILNDAIRD